MSDQADTIEPEVTANGVEVLNVVMDAAFDPGEIRHRIREATIARIAEDQRPMMGEARKGVREIDTVGNDDRIWTIPNDLHEQPHPVIGGDVLASLGHLAPPSFQALNLAAESAELRREQSRANKKSRVVRGSAGDCP
jgi:hypothetical protein